MFLALTLVLTIDPLRRWAVRKGAPVWAATVGALALLYGVLLVIVLGVGIALTQLVDVLPEYSAEFQDHSDRALEVPETFGVGAVHRVPHPRPHERSASPGLHPRPPPHLAAALHDFAQRIGRYWAVSTIFGLIQGVLNGVLLSLLDVPLPLVWGLLAFLTAHTPNIGFVIGLLPPVVLGLTLFTKVILIDSHPDSRWLGTLLSADRFIEDPAAPVGDSGREEAALA